jgi:steroid 5-alpha reductase family enzyme
MLRYWMAKEINCSSILSLIKASQNQLYHDYMIQNVLLTSLIALLACCTIMFMVWLWAKKINNAGVVDVFWALNFPVITVIIFFLADGDELRKILICIVFLLAELRLGLHLWRRVIGHLAEEEGRYQQLRKEWGIQADRNFFFFFQFQAISNVLLAIPFLIITVNAAHEIFTLEYIGLGIWLIAFVGEMIADNQLSAFKKNPANKGKVCDVGLWNYSRHPNYFFEWLTWMAYFVFALASPWGFLAIISPAIILYLLLKVTGVPNNEEQNLRSKPTAYKRYQETTSAFIPWFKKA